MISIEYSHASSYSSSAKVKLKNLIFYLQDELERQKFLVLGLQSQLRGAELEVEQKGLKNFAFEVAIRGKDGKISALEMEYTRTQTLGNRALQKNHESTELKLAELEEKCSTYIAKYKEAISKSIETHPKTVKTHKETQTWTTENGGWKFEMKNFIDQASSSMNGGSSLKEIAKNDVKKRISEDKNGSKKREKGKKTIQDRVSMVASESYIKPFADKEKRKTYAKRASEKMRHPHIHDSLLDLAKNGVPKSKDLFIKYFEETQHGKLKHSEILDAWFAILAEAEKEKEMNTKKAVVMKEGRMKIPDEIESENSDEEMNTSSKNVMKEHEKIQEQELKKRLYDKIMVEMKPKLVAFFANMQEEVRKEYEAKFSQTKKSTNEESTDMDGFDQFQSRVHVGSLKRKSPGISMMDEDMVTKKRKGGEMEKEIKRELLDET